MLNGRGVTPLPTAPCHTLGALAEGLGLMQHQLLGLVVEHASPDSGASAEFESPHFVITVTLPLKYKCTCTLAGPPFQGPGVYF